MRDRILEVFVGIPMVVLAGMLMTVLFFVVERTVFWAWLVVIAWIATTGALAGQPYVGLLSALSFVVVTVVTVGGVFLYACGKLHQVEEENLYNAHGDRGFIVQ